MTTERDRFWLVTTEPAVALGDEEDPRDWWLTAATVWASTEAEAVSIYLAETGPDAGEGLVYVWELGMPGIYRGLTMVVAGERP